MSKDHETPRHQVMPMLDSNAVLNETLYEVKLIYMVLNVCHRNLCNSTNNVFLPTQYRDSMGCSTAYGNKRYEKTQRYASDMSEAEGKVGLCKHTHTLPYTARKHITLVNCISFWRE